MIVKSVLITGGAGYKGTLLAEALLQTGCRVTLMDNFIYGYEPVLGFAADRNCTILKRDVRNLEEKDVKDYDIIYHLAAISGYPACEANPHSAQMINVVSTEKLVKLLSEDQVLVYASTTSLYGKSGLEQDEISLPTPASLYGITKWQAETLCMQRENSISFRFATLFGVSRRMRCDLLLNDFVYRAVNDRSIVLFDSHSVRTFLHVRDAIRAYVMAFHDAEKMAGQIYNVGSGSMNFSKLEIARIIQRHLHNEIIETQLADPDRRDFIINFDKITALGFKPGISIEEGILELLRLYSWYQPFQNYRPI
jgi:nucleoside-diphosphate-sugar epimerase